MDELHFGDGVTELIKADRTLSEGEIQYLYSLRTDDLHILIEPQLYSENSEIRLTLSNRAVNNNIDFSDVFLHIRTFVYPSPMLDGIVNRVETRSDTSGKAHIFFYFKFPLKKGEFFKYQGQRYLVNEIYQEGEGYKAHCYIYP